MRSISKSLLMITCALCAVAMGLAFGQAGAQAGKGKLMNPAALNEKAPDVFRATFDTSKGTFVIEVTRAWAPNGADRFYNLVKNGFYDNCRFFRVLTGFMAQFGINGDPKISAAWQAARIQDDPVKQSNVRGYVSFAKTSAPNSRTTQIFINFGNNARLDASGFAPFGKVVEGMQIVDSFFADYGEGAPGGAGPDQSRMQTEGNAYLLKEFPKLDFVKSAVIADSTSPAKKAPGK